MLKHVQVKHARKTVSGKRWKKNLDNFPGLFSKEVQYVGPTRRYNVFVQQGGTTCWYNKMVQHVGPTRRYNMLVQKGGAAFRFDKMVQRVDPTKRSNKVVYI